MEKNLAPRLGRGGRKETHPVCVPDYAQKSMPALLSASNLHPPSLASPSVGLPPDNDRKFQQGKGGTILKLGANSFFSAGGFLNSICFFVDFCIEFCHFAFVCAL